MMLHDSVREKKIEEGLELITRHFDSSEPTWPRWISTYLMDKNGVICKRFWLTHNKEEALALFKAANFLDCKIKGYNSDNIAPSLLLVDIDLEQFNTTEEFEQCAVKTLINFKEKLGGQPTQLWTGNGYHFLQPQFAIILEKVERFREFKEVSRRFLHFEEQLMTDGKADPTHCRTVSFNNCWLRIPGSLNSNQVHFNDRYEIIDIPSEAEVRIICYWDGERPSIKSLLPRYYIWLQAAVGMEIDKEIEMLQKTPRNYWSNKGGSSKIGWIDRLIDKPLSDHRKFCIRRVFVPYLINIKGLSIVDATDIIKSWLSRCDVISRLNFDPKSKIDYSLNHVGCYLPISKANLESENNLLYLQLEREGVIG